MKESARFCFRIAAARSASPIVRVTVEGLYVCFRQGVQSAKTVIRSRWPHVAVDLDDKGDVIGVEDCASAWRIHGWRRSTPKWQGSPFQARYSSGRVM